MKINKGLMNFDDQSVLHLGENDVPEIVDLLCDAFTEYPVMQYVLGTNNNRYSEHLRLLIHFFVMARVYRREFLLGVADNGLLQGAALVSRSSGLESPPKLNTLREKLWSTLGSSARTRYETYGTVTTGLSVPFPHIHVNIIGVRRISRGKRYGRKLLEYVHTLSSEDPDSSGVTLNTEDEVNVPFYEHFGYKLIGELEVSSGIKSWKFFRPNANRTKVKNDNV